MDDVTRHICFTVLAEAEAETLLKPQCIGCKIHSILTGLSLTSYSTQLRAVCELLAEPLRTDNL